MGSVDYNLNLLAFLQFYKAPEKHLFSMAKVISFTVSPFFCSYNSVYKNFGF